MDNPAINDTDTRAICEEIGERLRILLKPAESDETEGLADKLDELFARQDEDSDWR